MDSASPYAFEVVTLTLTFCLKNINLKSAVIFGYQQIVGAYTYVMKKTEQSKATLQGKPGAEATAVKSVHSFTEVKLERVGPAGIEEKLGNFQRASSISLTLFFNCVRST